MMFNPSTRTRFEVRLQPGWEAVLDDRPLDIKGRKIRALITLLSYDRGVPRRRETLAAMLWPDKPPRNALASLRQALSQIRRSMGEAADQILCTQRDDIAFAPGVVRTDFEITLNTLAEGDPGGMGEAWLTHITAVLNVFEGLSPDYDDWLSGLRARITRQSLHCLQEGFSSLQKTPEQRLRLARLANQLDEYNEKAVQAQMTCHALLNDNAAALQVYRDFFEKLDGELGGEPSEETQQLVARIKLSERPEPARAMPAAPVARTMSMVAVLPFERLGPTDVSQFQVLALLDQITCKLAAFKSPGVISSNSTRHYLDRTPRMAEVYHDLGAHYVVTGSISAVGPHVQLSVQMSSTSDNRVHWATSLSCFRDQLLAESAALADQIALAIEPSLNVAELERSELLPPEALEPHHYVLRAKNLMFSLARHDFEEAKRILDVVQTKHPHFGPGHALLAEWYAINLWQGWTRNPVTERALLEQHSRRSVALSPNNGRSLAMWGHNKFLLMDRDYDSSFRLFEQAMRLSPNDSETLIWTVPALAYGGQPTLALENAQRAFSLSPADPFLFRNEHFLSVAHYVNGNYEDAARLGLSCFRRAPNYSSNTRATIASLVSLGRSEDARLLVEHHNAIAPDFSVGMFKANHGYRDPDDREDYARKLVDAGLPD